MAARPVIAISSPPAPARKLKMCPAGAATPMGLRTRGGPEVRRRGANALPEAHAVRPAAAAQATGRQRRDGSDPVGKSSRTNTTNPTPRKKIQLVQLPQERVGRN